MNGDCWISPAGAVVPCPRGHLDLVYRGLDRFNLTRERLGILHGKGRLIDWLLEEGWIMVKDKGDHFLIEFDRWTLRHRGHIRRWMAGIKGKVYLVSRDGRHNRVVRARSEV